MITTCWVSKNRTESVTPIKIPSSYKFNLTAIVRFPFELSTKVNSQARNSAAVASLLSLSLSIRDAVTIENLAAIKDWTMNERIPICRQISSSYVNTSVRAIPFRALFFVRNLNWFSTLRESQSAPPSLWSRQIFSHKKLPRDQNKRAGSPVCFRVAGAAASRIFLTEWIAARKKLSRLCNCHVFPFRPKNFWDFLFRLLRVVFFFLLSLECPSCPA